MLPIPPCFPTISFRFAPGWWVSCLVLASVLTCELVRADSPDARDLLLPSAKIDLPSGDASKKIAGDVKTVYFSKSAYRLHPGPEAYRTLSLHGLADRSADRILVDLRLDSEPGAELVSFLDSIGGKLHERTWLAPFGGHDRGKILAEVPVDRLYDLAERAEVLEIRSAEGFDHPHNDRGASDLGAPHFWTHGLTGSGVRIGVLDSGLEIGHPDVPAPVIRRDYSAWPLIDLDVANRVTGHGTHVVGTALGRGNASGGQYKGVAPEAELVFIKIGNDANAGASYAAEENALRACVDSFACDVITMSYGGWGAYHDGSSGPAMAADYAWSKGAVVVFSAGNDGLDAEHYSGYVSGNSTSGFIRLDADFVPHGIAATLLLNLVWHDDPAAIDLQLSIYDSTRTLIPAAFFSDFGQTESARGTESQFFRYNLYVPQGHSSWYVKVQNNSPSGTDFHIYYSGAFNTVGGKFVKFASPDPDFTIASPANADSVIAVGAHVTRRNWTTYTGNSLTFGRTLGDLAPYSSRGPTVPGRQKPQLTAPGSAVISLRDRDVVPLIPASAFIIDNDGSNDGPPADYLVSEGTSMASPMVAGAVALMKEANPGLTPALARHLLLGLARADGFTGTTPNRAWGFGKLDAAALFPFLSVTSLQVTHEVSGGAIVVQWIAYGEIGVRGYDVYRSKAGAEDFTRRNEREIRARTDGAAGVYEFRDEMVRMGESYDYKILEIGEGGSTRYHGPYRVSLRTGFGLEPNRPNPFNPATTITYSVSGPGMVRLSVFDVQGRLVRILVDEFKDPGTYQISWNGRNQEGGAVASGLYFYRLRAGTKVATRKMILAK